MFDQKRRQTTIVYLSCLATTLILVFVPIVGKVKLLLLIIVMFVQFCASCWYSLSYIPYGRRTALHFIKKATGIESSDGTTNNYIGLQLPKIGGGGGILT